MVQNNYYQNQFSWESLVVLKDLNRSSIECDQPFIDSLEPSLWIELATEYDSDNFCEYLKHRSASGTLNLSSKFSEFERVWRRDELNHTRGFARLYSVLYSVDEADLFSRLRERKPDFSAIESLLADEFAICVVLAYDEIATTRSYQRDMMTRYPKFKSKALIDWIRLVARDEAKHCDNALNIITENHAHRIVDMPDVLSELIDFDAGKDGYGATFVLDHSANNYTAEFLGSCRSFILRRLGFVG